MDERGAMTGGLGLAGRKVLVTGAASGIGRATAELLASLEPDARARQTSRLSSDIASIVRATGTGSDPRSPATSPTKLS